MTFGGRLWTSRQFWCRLLSRDPCSIQRSNQQRPASGIIASGKCSVTQDSKAVGRAQPTALPCPPYVPFSRTASCRVVETGSEAVRLSSPSSQRGSPPRASGGTPQSRHGKNSAPAGALKISTAAVRPERHAHDRAGAAIRCSGCKVSAAARLRARTKKPECNPAHYAPRLFPIGRAISTAEGVDMTRRQL